MNEGKARVVGIRDLTLFSTDATNPSFAPTFEPSGGCAHAATRWCADDGPVQRKRRKRHAWMDARVVVVSDGLVVLPIFALPMKSSQASRPRLPEFRCQTFGSNQRACPAKHRPNDLPKPAKACQSHTKVSQNALPVVRRVGDFQLSWAGATAGYACHGRMCRVDGPIRLLTWMTADTDEQLRGKDPIQETGRLTTPP